MKHWDQAEEARRLAERLDTVNQAAFAEKFGVPGGPSMVSQHKKGTRPISLDAAVAYAKGFGVGLDEISPRVAALVRDALATMAPPPEPLPNQEAANVERGPYSIRGDIPAFNKPAGEALEQSLATIRLHLAPLNDQACERAGDALRLMALTPDSDRAFKNALASLTPTSGEELPRVQVPSPKVAHPTSQSPAETSPASSLVLGSDSEGGVWKQKRVPGGIERTDTSETYQSPKRPGLKKAAK